MFTSIFQTLIYHSSWCKTALKPWISTYSLSRATEKVQCPNSTTEKKSPIVWKRAVKGTLPVHLCALKAFVNNAWCASSHLAPPAHYLTQRPLLPPPHRPTPTSPSCSDCVKHTSDLPYRVSFRVAPPGESVGHWLVNVEEPWHFSWWKHSLITAGREHWHVRTQEDKGKTNFTVQV